jgi:hypothetical protein
MTELLIRILHNILDYFFSAVFHAGKYCGLVTFGQPLAGFAMAELGIGNQFVIGGGFVDEIELLAQIQFFFLVKCGPLQIFQSFMLFDNFGVRGPLFFRHASIDGTVETFHLGC